MEAGQLAYKKYYEKIGGVTTLIWERYYRYENVGDDVTPDWRVCAIVDKEGAQRMRATGVVAWDEVAETGCSKDDFQKYASTIYEYYTASDNVPESQVGCIKKVTSGACCGGGEQAAEYVYSTTGTTWVKKKITDERVSAGAAGIRTIEYFNANNQVIHKAVEAFNSGSTVPVGTVAHWKYDFNSYYQKIKEYTPSAFDASQIDLNDMGELNDPGTAEFDNVSTPATLGTGALIGISGDSGSSSGSGTGPYTVSGAGVGLTGTADGFHYRYGATSSTSFDLIARIDDDPMPSFGGLYGVMIRATLDANSKNAFVGLNRDGGDKIQFRYRGDSGNGYTEVTNGSDNSVPRWVKLNFSRSGDVCTITAYESDDPTTNGWTQITTENPVTLTVASMADVYVGLVATRAQSTGVMNLVAGQEIKSNEGLIRNWEYGSASDDADGLSATYQSTSPTAINYRIDPFVVGQEQGKVDFQSNLPGGITSTSLDVAWSGSVKATTAGTYKFRVKYDTGSATTLSVGGISTSSTSTDEFGNSYYTIPSSGTISFAENEKKDISISYDADATPRDILLEWSTDGGTNWNPIPHENLYSGMESKAKALVQESIQQGSAGSPIVLADYEYLVGYSDAEIVKKVTRYADYDEENNNAPLAPEVTEYEYPLGFNPNAEQPYQPYQTDTKQKLAEGVYLISKEYVGTKYNGTTALYDYRFTKDPNGSVSYSQNWPWGTSSSPVPGGGQVRFEVEDINTDNSSLTALNSQLGSDFGLDDETTNVPLDFRTDSGLNLCTSYGYDSLDGDLRMVSKSMADGSKEQTYYISKRCEISGNPTGEESRTYHVKYNGSNYTLVSAVEMSKPITIDGNAGSTQQLVGVQGWAIGESGARTSPPSETDVLTGVLSQTDSVYNASGQMTETRVYDKYTAGGTVDTTSYQTTEYVYYPDGRMKYVTAPSGLITYYTYTGITDCVYTVTKDGSTWTSVAPMRFTMKNVANDQVFFEGTYAVSLSGEPTALIEIPSSGCKSTMMNVFDWRDRLTLTSRAVTLETPAGFYYEGYNVYDNQDRVLRSRDGMGNCTATVYDAAGRPISQWAGTNDTGATREDPGAGSSNLVKVSETFYDLNFDRAGDDQRSYVTRTTTLGANLVALTGTPTDYTYTNYSAPYENESGTWVQWVKPEFGLWQKQVMDKAGRATESYAYAHDGETLGAMIAKSLTYYDAAGRVTSTEVYDVNDTTSPYDHVVTSYAYDAAGRQRKVTQPGGAFTLVDYDAAGRPTKQYLSTAGGDTDTVDDDVVVEQTEYQYDAAGRPMFITKAERNHDATAAGALTSSTARISYSAMWYDAAGRLERNVDGGTTMTERPSSIPSVGGDDYLVTAYGYNDAGLPETVTDNSGIVTKYYYDALGRKTYMVENYVSGYYTEPNPSAPSDRDFDQCRVTRYSYTANNQIWSQTAIDPNADGNTDDNQVTAYTYGGDDGVVSPIYQKSLLVRVKYPDGDNDTDNVRFTYFADGAPRTKIDQRGTEHTYEYSTTRKQKKDSITTQGDTAVDIAVRRIEREYDPVTDRLTAVTSYDADTGGNVLNAVAYDYNGLGQVTEEEQDHITVAASLQYAYDAGNAYRLKSVTYPNGRIVHYLHDGHNGIDNVLGRVNKIAEDSVSQPGQPDPNNLIAQYSYLGRGTVVTKDYPRPDIKLEYYDSTAGTYAGYDRFGRIAQQHWLNHAGTPTTTDDKDLFKIGHGYDLASNRLYADREVYKGYSQFYTYDNLHRLIGFQAGVLNEDKDDVPYWPFRNQCWELDAVGNQTEVNDYEDEPWSKSKFNKANEYKNEVASLQISGNNNYPQRRHGRSFWGSTDDCNYQTPDANDAFTIASYALNFTAVNQAAFEGEARGLVVLGENIGPISEVTLFYLPDHATTGDYVGMVLGYQGVDNYWMVVVEIVGANRECRGRLYHVENGNKGNPVAETESFTYPQGHLCQCVIKAKDKSMLLGFADVTTGIGAGTIHALTDGVQSGKVGLVTNVIPNAGACAKSMYLMLVTENTSANLLGGWDSMEGLGSSGITSIMGGGRRLCISQDPVFLRKFRGEKFQATFCAMKDNDPNDVTLGFAFDAKDGSNLDYIQLLLSDSAQQAPKGYSYENGEARTAVTADEQYDNRMPTVDEYENLWIRVEYDGSDLIVKCAQSENEPGDWSTVNYCYKSSNFDIDGGMVGFIDGTGSTYVSKLVVKQWDSSTSSWITETIEDFTQPDENYYLHLTLTHDAAGNLTYDGLYAYTYDAWNRLMTVSRAYRDPADPTEHIEGSVVATMEYDGLGRRIKKTVDNSGDWDCTYNYYYNGQQMVETRNGSDHALTQNVWGLQYVDELVQIGRNDDPADVNEGNCDSFHWALQDANYNVLGIVGDDGNLKERYEYTPYGQRTVFTSSGTADPLVMCPLLESGGATAENPMGLCDVGHQGLFHEREFGDMLRNSARDRQPVLGRFIQHDPIDYPDGMNPFEIEGSNPINRLDPKGLQTTKPTSQPTDVWKKGCCILKWSTFGMSSYVPKDIEYNSTKEGVADACKCWKGEGITWNKSVYRAEDNPCNCGVRILRTSTTWLPGTTIFNFMEPGFGMDGDHGHTWIESPMGNYGWAGGGINVVGWGKRTPDMQKIPDRRTWGSLSYGSKKSCRDATCKDIGECIKEAAIWFSKNKKWGVPWSVGSPDPRGPFTNTCSDFAEYIVNNCCMTAGLKWGSK